MFTSAVEKLNTKDKIMENEITDVNIKNWCLGLFKKYLDDEDLDTFIEDLTIIDYEIQDRYYDYSKEEEDLRCIWFKFYRNDCVSTTVRTLEKCLNPQLSPINNIEHYKEAIQIAVDNSQNFKIYFS
jgi:hypothetical protein